MSSPITIILTTTVTVHERMIPTNDVQHINKNERLEIYLRSIKQWLSNTNFHIIVVDNNNYSYHELSKELEIYKNRFEIFYYDEKILKDTKYLLNQPTKGINEIYAINYAFENSKLAQKSEFIIKVTGRYFLPDLENYLKTIDMTNIETIRQNNPDFCELVGCNKKHFYKIFNRYLVNDRNEIDLHVENIYKNRILWFDNILTLPEMVIFPPTTTGYLLLRFYL